MKKFFAIILSSLLIASASVTAFAQTTSGEDTSTDVKAKYVSGVVTPEVCSVDVSWGAMEFTYSESGTKDWNPQTHKYTYNTTSGWSANGNTVSVTNHSNKAVKADVKFVALPEYSDKVSGNFDKDTFTLESAVGSDLNNAPSYTVRLNLSGSVDSGMSDFTKIGAVTVTLGDKA